MDPQNIDISKILIKLDNTIFLSNKTAEKFSEYIAMYQPYMI